MRIEFLPKRIIDAISEFREYLDEANLLPGWNSRIDVVNCAESIDEVKDQCVYFCPIRGGQYSHRRSKYFGAYRNKTVKFVAEIDAVVDVIDEDDIAILWCNIRSTKIDVKNRAKEVMNRLRAGKLSLRVFLLSDIQETNFLKDSYGGMFGSKRYFEIDKKIKTTNELAKVLDGKKWSDFINKSET